MHLPLQVQQAEITLDVPFTGRFLDVKAKGRHRAPRFAGDRGLIHVEPLGYSIPGAQPDQVVEAVQFIETNHGRLSSTPTLVVIRTGAAPARAAE